MNELAKPVLPGTAGSDYERYLRTDELLSLQKTAGEWVHRDELLFQSVHQTSEIWLKLCWNEVEEAARLVGRDDVAPALRLLRRANDCLKLVTAALEMLEHMSPWEYTEVRKVLGHVTGHSIGMTMIEFPKVGEGSDVELKENMVLSMHPHAIAANGEDCLYMQDTWLVTAEGGVPLADLEMGIWAQA